ncbi:extracellular solute-binding protein [Sulfurisphaera ohwakuensis]|uniref:ABC transporter substrate-binding protein n=1 Tax=Sulfurisphaera ohwakuensis TaxID=69656 RepID=UPI0036F1A93C
MKAISTIAIAIIVIVVIAIIAAATYFIISSHHTPTTTTTSTTPITLTVVTFSGTSANFIQYAGELFHQLHPNVEVQVVQYPFSEYISKELTALEAHSSQYDIIGFTSTSALSVAPYLLPLNQSDFNFSDIIYPQEDFGGLYYNTSTGKTEIIGIAYETAVYLMAYNMTVFNNQTLAEEFEQEYHMNFSPITYKNWTVVLDVDEFLTSHHITKYGFLIDDHVAHGIIDAFPAVFGWYYFRDSSINLGNPSGIPNYNIMFEGKILPGYNYPLPSFNSTSGVEALMTYRELVNYEPNPSQIQISYDNLPEFFSQAAGAFLFTSQLSYINNSQDVLLAPLPGGYAETGTDFLGISKYSAHPQLALEFLQFLVSPKVQEIAFLKFGKFPVSKEAFNNLISNSSLPYYQREWLQETYIAALNASANPPNIPPTYPKLIPSFNNLVFQFLTSPQYNETYAMEILQQAANEWISALS